MVTSFKKFCKKKTIHPLSNHFTIYRIKIFPPSSLNARFVTVQDRSHSSAESDMTQKSTTLEKKFSLTSMANKSPRKLLKNPLKVVYRQILVLFVMIDNIFYTHAAIIHAKRQRKTFIDHFFFGKTKINHLCNMRAYNRNDNTWYICQ